MSFVDIQIIDNRWEKKLYDLESFVVKYFGFNIPKKFCTTVHLINDEMIKEINRCYRNKDKVTNVVSLSYLDEHDISFDRLIGEAFISYDRIVTESLKYNIPFRFYFGHILIHSSLHIMGYDHVTIPQYIKMVYIEKRSTKLLGIKISLAGDDL